MIVRKNGKGSKTLARSCTELELFNMLFWASINNEKNILFSHNFAVSFCKGVQTCKERAEWKRRCVNSITRFSLLSLQCLWWDFILFLILYTLHFLHKCEVICYCSCLYYSPRSLIVLLLFWASPFMTNILSKDWAWPQKIHGTNYST